MEEIHAKSSNVRSVLLKGIFDILKCHGQNVFCEAEDREVTFIDFLDDILSQSRDDTEERDIIVKGIFKIYTAHHTWSPRILSKLLMLLYHPDENYSVRKYVNCFLQTYGHSREEVECLVKSFLAIINLLFDSDKSSPYHNISIKTTALELVEFSKEYEHSEEFSFKEKFQDLLVLKLTKGFLKKPWRLSALDLYNICSGIMPKDHEKLLKLKENIKII
ncbi:Condensin complex subunit 3, partial [Stegodyphus mimosarum]